VAKPNPYASLTAPTNTSCSYNINGGNYFNSGGATYHFTQGLNVFCGNTTIGGNGSSDTFDPGIYYFNGSLTFSGANVTSASGVTFVVTGAFSWTDWSGTYQMSAPTSGPTAGILVWQTCGSGGVSPGGQLIGDQIEGGSILQVSGAIYMPCGALQLSNNAALTTASGGAMSVVVDTLSVTGSASIAASAAGTSTGGAASVVLQQ
jgi:hypothetical protein